MFCIILKCMYFIAWSQVGEVNECVDSGTGLVVPGDVMCPSDHTNCHAACVEPEVQTFDIGGTDFCTGQGVDM